MSRRNQFISDGLKKITWDIGGISPSNMAGVIATTSESLLEIMYDAINRPLDIKIKRSEDAKMFPMLKIGKPGDTGYDLHATFPYKEEFQDKEARDEYHERWGSEGVPYETLEADMRESIVLQPNERCLVPTGIHLELPYGVWALLTARSSTSKQMLIVPQGIIDEGYRGPLFAQLINVGTKQVEIKHGDRHVQMIVFDRLTDRISFKEVDELAPSERGATGFGSTGQGAVRDDSGTPLPTDRAVFSTDHKPGVSGRGIMASVQMSYDSMDNEELAAINDNNEEID